MSKHIPGSDVPELTESEVAAIKAMTPKEFNLFLRKIDPTIYAQNAERNRLTAIEFYNLGYPALARAVGRSIWRDYVEWGGVGINRDTLYWFAHPSRLSDPEMTESLQLMERVAKFASDKNRSLCDFRKHYIV